MAEDKESKEKYPSSAPVPPASPPGIVPVKLCSRIVQNTINSIQAQLKKDGLYNPEIAASIKKALPALRKVARKGSKNCNLFIEDTMKHQGHLVKRKDHFTRFFLNPFQKFITMGDSHDFTSERIPRKFIAVIKEAISLGVPTGLIDEAKERSEEVIKLYSDEKKEGGIDWESNINDWDFALKTIAALLKKGELDWDVAHKEWESQIEDEKRLGRLKAIGMSYLANEEIRKKMYLELTDEEAGDPDRTRLSEHILEHIFEEVGREPEESVCQTMCDDLIKLLSKDLIQTI